MGNQFYFSNEPVFHLDLAWRLAICKVDDETSEPKRASSGKGEWASEAVGYN